MPHFIEEGRRYALESPTLAPQASAYLWNRRMMFQVSCRGFAVAQFMQPEPAKYAHVPTLGGTHFMLPEQAFFSHHPGRFFYIKDNESGSVFSAPYEPARVAVDKFEFTPGLTDISWLIEKDGIELRLKINLCVDEVVELWTVTVRNVSGRARKVSLVPYFPVGFSSWMNMAGAYDPELKGVVAQSVAPYQKMEDYFKRAQWKDQTFLISEVAPDSWEANQAAFEGEGSLAAPEGLKGAALGGGEAAYEMPACILSFELELAAGESVTRRLIFGPAKDRAEVASLSARLLSAESFSREAKLYEEYVLAQPGVLSVETPDQDFDHFFNYWLPRQVFYHGDTHRLCTDPQTRNYLQDAMGSAFVKLELTRQSLLTAFAHQKVSGEMPDGIVLVPGAELKYINQIPHTDHCVWLVLCVQTYLAESGDSAFLDQQVSFSDDEQPATLFEHLRRSLQWLLATRDARGLSYIAQGDWCDPMNMVGHKGKGVSGWLTEALSYALTLWAEICEERGESPAARDARQAATELNTALNQHLWDGGWYGRGITDDGVAFGVNQDDEGRIFLNAQSWAFLCGAPSTAQRKKMLAAIDEHLDTPYGVQLLAPAFTKMRDDIGRVTQKFPGSAENGSIYNHASAFYAASLYHIGEGDRAFDVLRRMIPGPDVADIEQRGQLPVFVPNYYRGAYRQYPRTAGRSSQLFNTGTAAWFYRAVVEQLFGLRGEGAGLRFAPQLPSAWPRAKAVRQFRGATFDVVIERDSQISEMQVRVDGQALPSGHLSPVVAGQRYQVEIRLPL